MGATQRHLGCTLDDPSPDSTTRQFSGTMFAYRLILAQSMRRHTVAEQCSSRAAPSSKMSLGTPDRPWPQNLRYMKFRSRPGRNMLKATGSSIVRWATLVGNSCSSGNGKRVAHVSFTYNVFEFAGCSYNRCPRIYTGRYNICTYMQFECSCKSMGQHLSSNMYKSTALRHYNG